MSVATNGSQRNDTTPDQGDAPAGKVTPPPFGEIWEARASFVARVGEALGRFPKDKFVTMTVLLALVAVAALFLLAPSEPATARLIGGIAVALLITAFGLVALYASRRNATNQQERRDEPPQPGNAG